MSHLSQTNTSFGDGRTFLLVEATSPLVQAGLWRNGAWVAWREYGGEAGDALFRCVGECLDEACADLAQIDGFFYGCGPGSVLGARIAAMAVRSWRSLSAAPGPVYRYTSLVALARMLLREGTSPPFHVIADARRRRWHHLAVDCSGAFGDIRQIESGVAARLEGPVWRPRERSLSTEAPVSCTVVDLSFRNHAALFMESDFLQSAEDAHVFAFQTPAYQEWQGERHRAP